MAGSVLYAIQYQFTDFHQTNSNMKYGITILLCLAVSLAAGAQTVTGVWKTIDDETGEPKSHLELFEGDGKLYGKVVKLLKFCLT